MMHYILQRESCMNSIRESNHEYECCSVNIIEFENFENCSPFVTSLLLIVVVDGLNFALIVLAPIDH